MNSVVLENLRRDYPKGTRVELVHMEDEQAPPIGTRGTVIGVDDIGSIMVRWDNGSSLHIVYGEDLCKKIGKSKIDLLNELLNLYRAIYYSSTKPDARVFEDILNKLIEYASEDEKVVHLNATQIMQQECIKLQRHPNAAEIEKDITAVMQKHGVDISEIALVLNNMHEEERKEQALYYEAMHRLGISNRVMHEASVEEKAKLKLMIEAEVNKLRIVYDHMEDEDV